MAQGALDKVFVLKSTESCSYTSYQQEATYTECHRLSNDVGLHEAQ